MINILNFKTFILESSTTKILYHGTTAQRLSSIAINGLTPSNIRKTNWEFNSNFKNRSKNRIYASDTLDQALYYALDAMVGSEETDDVSYTKRYMGMLLSINTEIKPTMDSDYPGDFYWDNEIPISNIQFFWEKNWHPLSIDNLNRFHIGEKTCLLMDYDFMTWKPWKGKRIKEDLIENWVVDFYLLQGLYLPEVRSKFQR